MAAIVATVAYLGLEARAVEVQVQLIPGLPAFKLIELRDIGKVTRKHRGLERGCGAWTVSHPSWDI
jgi:magnesium chelatase family protein